jgi:hypothetical protein
LIDFCFFIFIIFFEVKREGCNHTVTSHINMRSFIIIIIIKIKIYKIKFKFVVVVYYCSPFLQVPKLSNIVTMLIYIEKLILTVPYIERELYDIF